MPRLFAISLASAALVLAMAATPVFAGVVTTTDPTSWNGMVDSSTLTNIDFNCTWCTNGSLLSSYSNNTNGATFTGSGAGGFTSIYWLNYPSYGGTVLVGGNAGGGTPSAINVTLPANKTALSLYVALASGATGTATISVNGVAVGTVNVGSTPSLTFYGLTSTTAITSVTVSSLNGSVVIDNVSFGSLMQVSGGSGTADPGAGGTQTADAATLVLGGSGLAFLALSKRLRGRILNSAA